MEKESWLQQFFMGMTVFDTCKQKGFTFHFKSLSPLRRVSVDGYSLCMFQVSNRMLGEGTFWGVGRLNTVDATTTGLNFRRLLHFCNSQLGQFKISVLV